MVYFICLRGAFPPPGFFPTVNPLLSLPHVSATIVLSTRIRFRGSASSLVYISENRPYTSSYAFSKNSAFIFDSRDEIDPCVTFASSEMLNRRLNTSLPNTVSSLRWLTSSAARSAYTSR